MAAWQPTKAAHLIILALKEVGKPYVLGSEGDPTAVLATWDCSELVQHMLAQVGITEVADSADRLTKIGAFDGAGTQFICTRPISVADAVKLPGALLFVMNATLYPDKPAHIGHVAISLGNGYVLEARGRAYGVCIGPVRPSFNRASKVNELYTPANLA